MNLLSRLNLFVLDKPCASLYVPSHGDVICVTRAGCENRILHRGLRNKGGLAECARNVDFPVI